MSRTARTFVVVIIAAGLLAACSSGNDDADKPATGGTVTTATAGSDKSPGGNSSGDSQDNGAAQAGIDLNNPPDPIGEVTVPINKDGITETKVEVLEAKKRGKVLLVTLRFTPEGTTSKNVSIFSAMGQNSFNPELIDLQNLKRYGYVPKLTVNDVTAKVKIGDSLYGYTAFPLPPDDLKTIDLKISELAPPIEDLPLP